MLFKLFNFYIHILYSFFYVRLYMHIALSNIVSIVLEISFIWKSLLLKVLNAILTIILQLFILLYL